MKIILSILFLLFNYVLYAQSDSLRWKSSFSLELEIEQQFFPKKGAYPNQKDYFISGAIKPKLSISSPDKRHQFVGEAFLRGSLQDPNRSHVDIREAYYRYNKGKWAISAGSKRIFWGVTESAHLVDIINQADQVEQFDGTEKLGQPMIQFTTGTSVGKFELYYLPISRRRQFAGEHGRFRFPVVLEREDIPFTTSAKAWHPSVAARWYNTFDKLDIGLSYFFGVTREPMYLGFDSVKGLDLTYPIIQQAGIDAQYTLGALMLKLEAIYRHTERQKFKALATGFEYTFGNVANKGLDIGIVSEYLYDSRGLLTFSGLDNDLFIGSRITFNDIGSSSFLIGSIFDLNKSTRLFRLEGSRRFKGNWKANVLATVLSNVSAKEILYNFRQDDLLQLSISKYF
jgi:hypothetical protein